MRETIRQYQLDCLMDYSGSLEDCNVVRIHVDGKDSLFKQVALMWDISLAAGFHEKIVHSVNDQYQPMKTEVAVNKLDGYCLQLTYAD